MNRRHPISLVMSLAVASVAAAQSATVTVSHDDPDGIVLPGQTINVRVEVAWTGGSTSNWIRFAGLSGDALPTPRVGSSSNITSVFQPNGLISLGQPGQGGVLGVDVAITPIFGWGCYPWPPPATGPTTLAGPLVAFDWTAPTDFSGPVTFAFDPSPTSPSVRLYPSQSSPAWVEAQTTYRPVSITVIPAPAGLWIAGATLAAGARRSRPPA